MIIIHLILLLCFSLPTLAESVRIQVVDVGQADGIVIRTPSMNNWVVIDAGIGKKFSDYLVEMGVPKLDMAIVSHRHKDHQHGMVHVLNNTPVDLFVGNTDDCPNRTGDDNVRTAISNNSVSTHTFGSAPHVTTIDGVTFTILPIPPTATCPQHENLNSIIVRIDYGKFSMLFVGDAEEDELKWLVDNHSALIDVDVLKASHHGSNNGVSDDFLAAVSPKRVVISAGVHGTYKHPMKDAVEDYLDVTNNNLYCTNRHMTVRIYGYTDRNSIIHKQNKINKSCVYDGKHY